MMMTQANSNGKHLNSNLTNRLIQILIVDDSKVVREGLKVMLETELDFAIVGMVNDGNQALEQVKVQPPDVILMDLEMPELDGISATKIICEQYPQIKVLVFSIHNDTRSIAQSLEAGAKGYLLKQSPIEQVVQSIRSVDQGCCHLGPGLLEDYLRQCYWRAKQDDNVVVSAEIVQDDLIVVDSDSEPEPTEIKLEPTKNRGFRSRIAIWAVPAAITLGLSGWAISQFAPSYSQSSSTPPSELVATSIPEPTAVAALGRIEPEGEIIQLSVSAAAEGSKVEQLLVERGDWLEPGQIVAILDSHDHKLAALNRAKTDVQIAEANLNRVRAGAKSGDISAQRATIARLEAELEGQIASQQAEIARLEAELDNAQVEYRRYDQLYQQGGISAQERDTRRLRVDTVQQQLQQAQETLNRTIATTRVQRREAIAKLDSISEVRAVDLEVAQAELQQAKATVQQAQTDLDLTKVRSPLEGQVLKVNVRPGEVIGSRGIAEIAKTDQMYVVAEVYETDVERVRLGQKAIVTGAAFSEELEGQVAQIGLEVQQQNVFESDPLVNTDNKVVEVKIRLSPESSQRVRALSNLQVQVLIVL